MSDTLRPKRSAQKSGRAAPRRTQSRPDGKAPARPERTRGEAPEPCERGRDPRTDALLDRLDVLEGEVARLNAARDTDADELARMLVRIAEAERGRAAAEERAEMAARRATLSERAVSDGAEALEGARAEREADRARVVDLETKLARLRREHTDELASLRSTHAEAELVAARGLEEERAATARAFQNAGTAQAELSAARDVITTAAALLEEMERREEIAAALRARALDQVRRVVGGEEIEAAEEIEVDAAEG